MDKIDKDRNDKYDNGEEMQMKITAGLGSIDEYERFVNVGADEFFCGYVPYEWTKKYGTVMPLNRREVLSYNVQIGSLGELEILAAMVKEYEKPVHLTFNTLYYIPEQYPEIAEIIKKRSVHVWRTVGREHKKNQHSSGFVERKSHKMQKCGLQIFSVIL